MQEMCENPFFFLKTRQSQQKSLSSTKMVCNSVIGFSDVLVAKYLTTGMLNLVWTEISVDSFNFIAQSYGSDIIKLCFGTSLICSINRYKYLLYRIGKQF